MTIFAVLIDTTRQCQTLVLREREHINSPTHVQISYMLTDPEVDEMCRYTINTGARWLNETGAFAAGRVFSANAFADYLGRC